MRVERVYLFTGAAQGFVSAWGLAAIVWWVVELGLSPIQLVLLGTALEAAVLVGEVPTGVVADLYSRKWSVVASYIVMGVGMALTPIDENFLLLLAWQVLWGIGWTLQSGADTAWATDELGYDVDDLIVRHAAWRSGGIVVGLPVAAALGAWSLEGAMVIIGLSSIATAGLLALVMTEHGFTPKPATDRSRWSDSVALWRQGATIVRRSPMLRVVVGTMVIMGGADEAVDRLDVLRLVDIGLPDFGDEQGVVFFGVIWWGMTLLNIPLMLWLARRVEQARDVTAARLMQLLLLIAGVGIMTLALSPLIAVAVVGWAARDVARELIEPIGVGLANRHAATEVRATVISFRGQAEAVGEVGGGLMFGAIAQFSSAGVALAAAGVFFVLAAAPYAGVARRLE